MSSVISKLVCETQTGMLDSASRGGLVMAVLAVLLFLSPAAQAATVELVISGVWQFESGSDPNLVDPKNLDGANVEYRFRYDDSQTSVFNEAQPIGTPGFCTGDLSTTCTFLASGSVSFTNRPGGMNDVIGSFGGETLAQSFAPTDPGLPLFWRMILPTPESGIFANTGFGNIRWGTPSASGSGVFATNALSEADFALLDMTLREVTLFPNGAYRYVLEDVEWSVATVVPLPAGVWLLGSALLGFGVLRRGP